MRLIDAEALKEKLVREHNALDGDDAMREGLVYAYMCIDEAPTARISEAKWEQDRANFVGILNGNLTIEKLPYKPKYGEAYCTYATDDDKWVVNCKIWTDWVEEFTALKCGIVFRTREEAEAALPAKYEELTGRKFSGNDEE